MAHTIEMTRVVSEAHYNRVPQETARLDENTNDKIVKVIQATLCCIVGIIAGGIGLYFGLENGAIQHFFKDQLPNFFRGH